MCGASVQREREITVCAFIIDWIHGLSFVYNETPRVSIQI